jgi:hypothetical protein
VSTRWLSGILAIPMLTAANALPAQTPALGSISGVVQTEDGTPLRARVWLVGVARPKPANSRGTFRFDSLTARRYHLRATYLGFSPLDTTLSVTTGARLQIVIKLTSMPVELSVMTIRDSVPPVEIPKPKPKPRRPITCARLMVLSPMAMLCMTPQMLVRTTVQESETFLGPNLQIIEAAQEAVREMGFVSETFLPLNDRTWLIVAHERAHPSDRGSARLVVEETGPNDTTVRVVLTTISWKRYEQHVRARAFLLAVRRKLR